MVTHTSVGDKVELVSATAAERALSGEREGPRKGGLFEKLLGREVEARAAEAEAEASENGDLLPVREDRPEHQRPVSWLSQPRVASMESQTSLFLCCSRFAWSSLEAGLRKVHHHFFLIRLDCLGT